MPAIRHDPKADIQLIRGILRAGYEDGFPVLKELLQNSDDAGAGRLGATASTITIMLVANGLPGGTHSLLKEPAICVLNDGEFRESDAECLPTLGLSNKASDATSIGKFGIGLKTVFYLGEAFFYFCDKEVDWSEKTRACDLVSPWGEYRQEWEDTWIRSRAQDHARLREFARSCGMASRVFGIWIPLRRHEPNRGLEYVHQHFPAGLVQTNGLLGIFGKDWTARLAELFPLQRNLRTIKVGSFVSGRGFNGELQLSFHADSNFLQVTNRADVDGEGWRNQFGGIVDSVEGQSGTNQTFYHGREVMGLRQLHDQFQAADNWPRQAISGQTTDEKERATPHVAIVVTKSPAIRPGRLQVQPAVFLPLGNAEALDCQGKWDFSLFCHGFFFVDSSRRHLEPFDIQKDKRLPGHDGPLTEADLRRAWNCSLFTELVCPEIIPTLDGFILQTKLANDEIESLVKSLSAALVECSLFRGAREWVFAQCSYLYRLGEKKGQWQLADSGVPIYAIPNWAGEFETLIRALPGLKRVIGEAAVTFDGKPLLALKEAAQLPDDTIAPVLSEGCANVFGPSGILPYLLELLPRNLPNRDPESPLIRSVVSLCCSALTTPHVVNGELQDERLRLFSRLPDAAIVQLPLDAKDVGVKLATALAEETLPAALLWRDWTGKMSPVGSLPWDAVRRLLTRLAALVPDDRFFTDHSG